MEISILTAKLAQIANKMQQKQTKNPTNFGNQANYSETSVRAKKKGSRRFVASLQNPGGLGLAPLDPAKKSVKIKAIKALTRFQSSWPDFKCSEFF